MKIAVFGAGGVGALFGARLMQAGEEVTFLARGHNLRALQTEGLYMQSVNGDFHLPTVCATDSPAEVGVVDAVLLGVKTWQVPGVAAQLGPLVGPDTLVIPLQNGVEAAGQVAAAVGWAHTLGGFCRAIVQQVAPGHFLHAGIVPSVAFGAVGGGQASLEVRAEPLRAAFRRAGVTVETPTDMQQALWEKFLFVEPWGAVGAASRASIGEMRQLPETQALLRGCLHELLAVGQGLGIQWTAAAVEKVWRLHEQAPAAGTSSMQRDLMAGRPSELEGQTGAVVRLGRAANVPTPLHEVLYAMLLPQEERARNGEVSA